MQVIQTVLTDTRIPSNTAPSQGTDLSEVPCGGWARLKHAQPRVYCSIIVLPPQMPWYALHNLTPPQPTTPRRNTWLYTNTAAVSFGCVPASVGHVLLSAAMPAGHHGTLGLQHLGIPWRCQWWAHSKQQQYPNTPSRPQLPVFTLQLAAAARHNGVLNHEVEACTGKQPGRQASLFEQLHVCQHRGTRSRGI